MEASWAIWWLALISTAASQKFCPSIDVRNRVAELKILSGCQVIEGFLFVVLIESAKEADYANYTFPELREVTDFVIFYRVSGLRSIGSLFPNLSIIRGEKLFHDYAFAVYKMPQLYDVSLPSLRILRGSVLILNNTNLCYGDTVNWSAVAPAGIEPLVGYNHQYKSGCCECPGCDSSCGDHCWTQTVCQTETLDVGSEDCHEECIGGCTGPGPAHCVACKTYIHNGTCVKECPPEAGLHLKARHCIPAQSCGDPKVFHQLGVVSKKKMNDAKKWFQRNNNCTDRGEVCSATKVSSIEEAQTLRGCTRINGSLVIQITTGKQSIVAKELEESLGNIEVIKGFLKIVWSFPLVNLNFFKNLRVIEGLEYVIDDGIWVPVTHSFLVHDNGNLQEIWNWSARPAGENFTIKNGKPLFHYNPKLCQRHIDRMIEISGVKNVTTFDVGSGSNGGYFACLDPTLNITVVQRTSTSVTLVINNSTISPDLNIRSYIAYKETNDTNTVITGYENDDCSQDNWHTASIMNLDPAYSEGGRNSSIRHRILKLKPYTMYAFYSQIISVNKTGEKSSVVFARTLPTKPGPPAAFYATANSSSVISLRWVPPQKPNGRIVEYTVTGYIRQEAPDLIRQRNYCRYPPQKVVTTTPPPLFLTQVNPKNRTKKRDEVLCVTPDHSLPLFTHETVNSCEKYMYDLILTTHLGHDGSLRKEVVRRDTEEDDYALADLYKDSALVRFKRVFSVNDTSGFIRDLKHFSIYTLELRACREEDISEDLEPVDLCSAMATISLRTLPDPSMDDIEDVTVSVNNRSATVKWPQLVGNGLITAYHVELSRTDGVSPTPKVTCVSAYEAQGIYLIQDLSLGEYQVRVRAVSLSGLGRYSTPAQFSVYEYSMKNIALVGSIFIFVVFVVAAAVFAYYYEIKSLAQPVLIASVNPEYYFIPDEKWCLPRNRVKVGKELKRGHFGVVCEGILSPEGTVVAVKRSIESASGRDIAEFLNEAMIMRQFTDSAHIVKLIGVVADKNPVLVVMEMMEKGDLKTFLRESRTGVPPTPNHMLLMAAQIADGMAYLEAAKFVHRDLAARNCMVTADNVVKIGDFGMTRDIYENDYYRKGNKGLLPIRWMAPESLNDGVFTTKSDVWSYGIVLWEMVTLASQPYQGMSNEQVFQHVVSGNKLELPPVYPKRFKPIMLWCWKWKPKFRPTFIQILMELEEYMTVSFRAVSFYHSPAGVDMRGLNAPDSPHCISMSPLHQTATYTVQAEPHDESNSPVPSCSH